MLLSPRFLDQEKKSFPAISEKMIVKFRGDEYDISDFINKHPGGKKILIDNNGNDVEKLMADSEHSKHAYETLSRYKIIK
jgi:cytochrome b involved in lipid metabolism